jgi:hypothetical protein
MGLLAGTPLIDHYLRSLAGIPDSIGVFVRPALILSAVLPLINSWHSWYRGLLMSARLTRVIYWGMGINLGLTALIIFVGALAQAAGAETAVVALILSLVVEVFYLRARQT